VCVCVCEDGGEWSGLTTVLTTDSVYRLKTFNWSTRWQDDNAARTTVGAWYSPQRKCFETAKWRDSHAVKYSHDLAGPNEILLAVSSFVLPLPV